MKKRNLGLIFAGMLIFAVVLAWHTSKDESVCFSSKCVSVEVVSTPETRARGLMFRESLGENEGMLFVFERSGNYPFWMKNTLIPLDIIWLDEEFKIVHIANAVPCVEGPCLNYNPNANARYVVEVNAGFAEENGVGVGDVAEVRGVAR